MSNEQPIFVRGRLSATGIVWLRRVFQFLFWVFTEVEVRGQENLPAQGPFIISPNHLSRFDAPLVFMFLSHHRVAGFVADTYRRNWFFRTIAESIDIIWVARGAITPTTMKSALRALKDGCALGLAPEGTRSPTHALLPGKTGVAYLALSANVPIVPTAITNAHNLGAAMLRLRRIKLTVTFGPPLYLTGPKTTENLAAQTTEVMCHIAALLPPEYRGVYADHPRLIELLQKTP